MSPRASTATRISATSSFSSALVNLPNWLGHSSVIWPYRRSASLSCWVMAPRTVAASDADFFFADAASRVESSTAPHPPRATAINRIESERGIT